jgi:DNA-binding response OmpR family regulator
MKEGAKSIPAILCIDDDQELLGMLGECLEQQGFSASTAADADQGMRLMDERKVDVVILDVNLAGEDGIRLMTFLKANHPKTPIIIYTGLQHDEEEVRAILRLGASGYAAKGNPISELVGAIRQVYTQTYGHTAAG